MSDESDNLNRPPPDDTEETPPLPEPPRPADEVLAASLAELAPAPAKIDRDRLMFEAGSTSRVGTIRLWQGTAGFLAAVGFAAGMYFKPPVIREVYVETPADPRPSAVAPVNPAPPAIPAARPEAAEPEPEPMSLPALATADDTAHWLQIRNDVLTAGIGAIPDHGRQPGPAPNVGLNQPAPLPRGVFSVPK
jgi:hypothetical protein